MTDTTTTAAQTEENATIFTIPNSETQMKIVLDDIPAELRMELLRKAAEGYVRNAVNQANMRHKKALEPWDAYEAAQAADAMQTAVKKPDGEKPGDPDSDLIEAAQAARKRLYENDVRRQTGGGKSRAKKDPLVTLVTNAVVRELFDKRHKADSSYKWTDAVKEVGGDGKAYLEGLVEKKVEAGAERGPLEKALNERYIKPAELMLGQRDNKAINDGGDLFD